MDDVAFVVCDNGKVFVVCYECMADGKISRRAFISQRFTFARAVEIAPEFEGKKNKRDASMDCAHVCQVAWA